MANNANFKTAKIKEQPDFYTRRIEIENELCHYSSVFKDKVVYCNCNDTEKSEFWQFFRRNYRPWGLKGLIAISYEEDSNKQASMLEISDSVNSECISDLKKNPSAIKLESNGDFRSKCCIDLLKRADVVVTQSPFQLFREYVLQLIEHNKQFLIIGPKNSIHCKEIFPLIKNNRIWLGYGFAHGDAFFYVSGENIKNLTRRVYDPKSGLAQFRNMTWFTNLDIPKIHEPMDLRGNYYDPDKYPKYDNYDAINVNFINDIPCDYDGVMGVPSTIVENYCPEQFDILGISKSWATDFEVKKTKQYKSAHQHDKTGISNGNKVNDGAVIALTSAPKDRTYYTDDNEPGKYFIQVYPRVLSKTKHYSNKKDRGFPMAKNANLHKAKAAKNDEFYTQRVDIENELSHYAEHFKDKVVYCNCDDPETSEFWLFFKRNFKPWGLKRLIATHYEPDAKNYAYVLEISQDTNGDGVVDWKDDPTITPLPCNGDFRSAACIELLKQADIVVTNPPFSLFREYVAQLIEYDKKFLIIGNMNAITYKEIFPLLKNNKIWLGYNHPKEFRTPNGGIQKFGNVMWFTNLDIPKRHVPLDLRGNYYYGNEDKYPKYDNYDAIECSKVSDIPEDYEPCWYKCEHAAECEYAQKEGHPETIALCEKACNGEIGVPITYLDRHNEAQIETVGADYEMANPEPLENGKSGTGRFYIKDVDNREAVGGQSLDKTRQDKTRQDKTRQDKTRQDKTRQDKTRQDKTSRLMRLYSRIVIRHKKKV